MNSLTKFTHTVGEQIGDFTRAIFPFSWNISGIRGFRTKLGLRFWPQSHPAAEGTQVNYDYVRSLYRNENDMALGAGFVKPIVDLQVAFMGIPTAATGNSDQDEFLNECLNKYWTDELQQMFRDSIRDSKCIVRMHQPDIFDRLMTMDEAEHRTLEILPPERVDIELDPRNKNVILRAVVRHRMTMVKDQGDPAKGQDPTTEEHDVIEIIDQESYRFFDQMENAWITDMESVNRWGFVPLLEVHNEWDSALQSGQSDIETVIPFIRAFHDVLTQGLQAHKYHSTPKIKLKLNEVGSFIQNNFPEVIDPATGQINPNAEISWRGREIIFLQPEEDMDFVEARSVLGDTKTLLEFLVDCISISSSTPEWAFMRVDSGSANSDRNAQTVPFTKKIDRKRRNATGPVQMLLKMVLASRDLIPVRATLSWDTIRADDQVVEMQAFQQLVMGLEAALASGQISNETYMAEIKKFLPSMKSLNAEATQAANDHQKVVDEIAKQAAASAPKLLPAGQAPAPVKGGPQGKNE